MRRKVALTTALSVMMSLVGCGRADVVGKQPKDEEPEQAPPKIRATDEPQKIVATAVEACGGIEIFDRWKVGRIKYKAAGQLVAEIPPGSAYVVEETFHYPDQFKRAVHFTVKGDNLTLLYVINGDKAWRRLANGVVEELPFLFPEKDRHDFGRLCDFTRLAHKDVKLSVVGEEQVEGRPAILVRAKFENGGEFDCYFDKASAFLVKNKTKGIDPRSGKKTVNETVLGQYKDVQGGKVPMKIKGYRDGKLGLDVTLTEVQFLNELNEKEFARP